MLRRQALLHTAGGLAWSALPRWSAAALPVASPTGGVRKVVLRAAPLEASAPARQGLSFDGTPGGPLVRVPLGTTLDVTLSNGLGRPTGLRWQGLRGVSETAGPLDEASALEPGGSSSMRLTPPDSGTFWFHAAPIPGGDDQTTMGLRGMLIVEEASPPPADREWILVLSDTAEGVLAVNGSAAPARDTVAAGGRVRLRLLNASTSRLMVVGMDGVRPQVLAVDGQPCPPFAPVRDAVPIGPGARFDLMFDAPRTPNETVGVRLRALVPPPDPGVTSNDLLIAELTTTGPARPPRPPIAALAPNAALPVEIHLEQASRPDVAIEAVAAPPAGAARFRLNGRASVPLPRDPLFSVPQGRPVTLGLRNRTAEAIPIRLQGQVLRLLHAKDDGWEPYWRDGVVLPPGSDTHVAFVPTAPGRWIIDSAIFAQGCAGLRTWFRVDAS